MTPEEVGHNQTTDWAVCLLLVGGRICWSESPDMEHSLMSEHAQDHEPQVHLREIVEVGMQLFSMQN